MRLPRLLAVLAAVALSAATYAQRPPACPEFAARLPNLPLRLCQQAALQPGPGRSVQGTPLYMRDVVAEDARLRVLVTGAVHGDELSSASVAMRSARRWTPRCARCGSTCCAGWPGACPWAPPAAETGGTMAAHPRGPA